MLSIVAGCARTTRQNQGRSHESQKGSFDGAIRHNWIFSSNLRQECAKLDLTNQNAEKRLGAGVFDTGFPGLPCGDSQALWRM